MDRRSDRGMVASGLVVGVAVVVLVAAVGFVLLAKRGGEEAASAASTALDAASEADDRQAQSALRNGMAAAKTAYTDSGSYGEVTPEALQAIEPSLSFTAGPSTDWTHVSVAVTDQQIGLAALSGTGTCWWIGDDVSNVSYGSGTACTGADALAGASAASW